MGRNTRRHRPSWPQTKRRWTEGHRAQQSTLPRATDSETLFQVIASVTDPPMQWLPRGLPASMLRQDSISTRSRRGSRNSSRLNPLAHWRAVTGDYRWRVGDTQTTGVHRNCRWYRWFGRGPSPSPWCMHAPARILDRSLSLQAVSRAVDFRPIPRHSSRTGSHVVCWQCGSGRPGRVGSGETMRICKSSIGGGVLPLSSGHWCGESP